MSGLGLAGVRLNEVYTTREFALGDTTVVGSNRYQFVLAAAAIAAGDAVIADNAHADEPYAWRPSTAVDQPLMGIAHMAIPSGSFGWVTIEGRIAAAKVAAATAAGTVLGTSATAGTLAAATATTIVQGRVAHAVDAEAGGLAEVHIA